MKNFSYHREESEKTNLWQLLLVVSIFVFPLLMRGYVLPFGNNTFIGIFNIIVVICCFKQQKIFFEKNISIIWLLIILWMLFVEVTVLIFMPYSKGVNDTSFHNAIIFFDACFLIMIFGNGILNTDLFIKIYKYCIYLIIFFLFIQYIAYYLCGIKLSGRIPFLEYESNNTFDRSILIYGEYIRCSSILLEPSHFAQFVAPYLCLSLYGFKHIVKKNYIVSFIVSISLLLSLSASSIILLAIIWITFFFQRIKEMDKKKLFQLIVGVVFFIVAFVFALQMKGVQVMIADVKNANDIKTSIRLTRGFTIFSQLPIWEKYFGIGFQNISSVGEIYNINEANNILNGNNEYVNCIAGFLLYFGIVGFAMAVGLVVKIWQHNDNAMRMIIICLFAIFISDAMLDLVWLFYMCIGIAVVMTNYNLDKNKSNDNLYV